VASAIVSRYARILPSLAFVLLLFPVVLYRLDSNSRSIYALDLERGRCGGTNWIWSVAMLPIYLLPYFFPGGRDQLCMPHTWYLAADMEVTVIVLALYAFVHRVGRHTLPHACAAIWALSGCCSFGYVLVHRPHIFGVATTDDGFLVLHFHLVLQSFLYGFGPCAMAGVLAAHAHHASQSEGMPGWARWIAEATGLKSALLQALMLLCLFGPWALAMLAHMLTPIEAAVNTLQGNAFEGGMATVVSGYYYASCGHAIGIMHLLCFFLPNEGVTRALKCVLDHEVMHAVARWVFGVYLLHGPIAVVFFAKLDHPYNIDFLDEQLVLTLMVVGYLSISFVAGLFLHHFVELPWGRVANHFLHNKREWRRFSVAQVEGLAQRDESVGGGSRADDAPERSSCLLLAVGGAEGRQGDST